MCTDSNDEGYIHDEFPDNLIFSTLTSDYDRDNPRPYLEYEDEGELEIANITS